MFPSNVIPAPDLGIRGQAPSGIQTLYEKIWNAHVVAAGPGERTLIYIDRHLLHDGSFHAFEALRRQGRKVRRPDAGFATPDHYAPTRGRDHIANPELRGKVETLEANARATRITLFALNDPRQGIVHVIGPEQASRSRASRSSAATRTHRPTVPWERSPSASAPRKWPMCSLPRPCGKRRPARCA